MRVTSFRRTQAVSVAVGAGREEASGLGSRLASLQRRRVAERCLVQACALPRQRGAALVMGMILLVLLSLLGLAGLGTSLLEERMAGNARDRIRALQAAEAALRLCESAVTANAVFDTNGGSGGMYSDVDPQRWRPNWNGWMDPPDPPDPPTATREYTGLPLVARQPRCIVERLSTEITEQPGAPESRRAGMPVETERIYRHYRVTARGVGVSERSVVMLQSHLRRMDD